MPGGDRGISHTRVGLWRRNFSLIGCGPWQFELAVTSGLSAQVDHLVLNVVLCKCGLSDLERPSSRWCRRRSCEAARVESTCCLFLAARRGESMGIIEHAGESMQEGSPQPGTDVQPIISNTCVVLNSDGSLNVVVDKQLEVSSMAPGSVLLQLVLSEVCGTDVHLQHGRLDTVPYPIIPGHVAVGRVYATAGSITDVEGSEIGQGDIVTYLDVIDTCNSCVTCLVDKQTTRCPRRRVLGITCSADPNNIQGLLGGWSSFVYLPPNTKIIRLPQTLPASVFMAGGCGLPTALHAVDRANIRLMDRVIVQGSGPVGLLAAILARLSGALQVIVVGAPAHRLNVVTEFGIDHTINLEEFPDSGKRLAVVHELTSGHLGDVVIEATGRPEAVTEGMMLCRDGGTYIIVGQYTDNGDVALNPHHMINRKHLTVKGCWGSDFSHFYRGVQFMTKYAASFPWHLVVSQIFDLKGAHKALAAVERLEVFKALLKPM